MNQIAAGGWKRWRWLAATAVVVLAVVWIGRSILHRDPKTAQVAV